MSRYANNKKKVAGASISDYALIHDESERAELDELRGYCIARQAWLEDRSFHVGFARGEEIAWPSIEAFDQARQDYLKKIQRRRGSKVGRVGERKNSRYGFIAAWSHLRLVVLILAAVGLFYYLADNRFFLSKGENRIWIPSDERAQVAALDAAGVPAPVESEVLPVEVPEPVVQLRDLGAPAGDVPELRAEAIAEHNRLQALYYTQPAMAWSRRLQVVAYGLFCFWILRRMLRRKKPDAPTIPKSIRLDMLPE